MSTHGSYSTLVNSRAPRHAPGATAQSYRTYSSAAHEPDANSSTLTVPPWSANLATSRGPFIQAMIDVFVIAFWVFLILISAASVPVALFMMLFCSFE